MIDIWDALGSIGLGFLEGLGLIFSPCVLPILPIVLATSWAGSGRRACGIMIGFITFFASLVFFSRYIIHILLINFMIVRWMAYALLIFLGCIMLSTRLSRTWERCFASLQGRAAGLSTRAEAGFKGGVVLGALISLVWVPCAGPILAAVIVQTVVQTADWVSFLILLAFAAGVALPMLWMAWYGHALFQQFSFFRRNAKLFRKILGGILLLTILVTIISQYYYPEKRAILRSSMTATELQNGVLQPYVAPEFSGIQSWLNASAQSLERLRNRVVLVDFWTYSCINCLRTIPYLNALYAHYHDQGFVIVGVHSPEFEFEHDIQGVREAVTRYAIHYPVALDNQFSTWLAYQNHYWPAQYLIDQHGNVVYVHFGEGAESILENNIRYLLHLDLQNVSPSKPSIHEVSSDLTPEIYLGAARSRSDLRPQAYTPKQIKLYAYPAELVRNTWALKGQWYIDTDAIHNINQSAAIQIHVHARHVYAVLGSTTQNVIPVILRFKQTLFGQVVWQKTIFVQAHRLYELVDLKRAEDGYLEIQAQLPGLACYTMTFGG